MTLLSAAKSRAVLALLCLAASTSAFKIGLRPAAPAGLIVKLRGDAVGAAAAAAAGGGNLRPIGQGLNLYRLKVADGSSIKDKAAELERLREVEYAVPDDWISLAVADGSAGLASRRPPPRPRPPLPRRRPPPPSPKRRPSPPPPKRRPLPPLPRPRPPPRPRPRPPPRPLVPVPNDGFYSSLWGLPKVRAPQAWARWRDGAKVRTCIVDTGVMYNHLDLAPNLVPMSAAWVAANTDDHGHGTHVAGTIGAVGNNRVGVTGVAWRARILACKALNSNGWGSISSLVDCIHWCRSRGAGIINLSVSTTELSVPLRDAIGNATAAGVFIAAAAGNGGYNNDARPSYPASFKFKGNVAVANINSGTVIDGSSNYGATSVQVAAPGTQILSTWIWRDFSSQYYTFATGTSMASPYVAGAAALALSASNGTLTNVQLANLLIATSTPVPALRGRVVANGVINLEQLLLKALAARAAG